METKTNGTGPLEILAVERLVCVDVRKRTAEDGERIDSIIAQSRSLGLGVRVVDLSRDVRLSCPEEVEAWLMSAVRGESEGS